MRFRAALTALTILATIGLWTSDGLACSCAGAGLYRCALPAAPVSFLGRVISKQPVDRRPVEPRGNNPGGRRLAIVGPPPIDDSYTAVTFQVTEWFRGGSDATIIVRTD